MHYILSKDESWIKTLRKEITADFTKAFSPVERLPVIRIFEEIDFKNSYMAFSSTALINVYEIAEDSVSKQTIKILEYIFPLIPEGVEINFHAYGITHKYGIIETGRAEIFKGKILSALRMKNISCHKKGFNRQNGFLQILVMANRSLAISYIKESEMNEYHSLLSPFIGGFNNVEDDKQAPSRAFKKIVEAQELMGKYILPGELLVDLGACPGGWSYIARKNGARVIAVDRSPLHKNLMSDKKIEFIKGDAFKYKTSEAVDWVVSDIICAPERILELLESWVVTNHCKNFIFTIKFQGQKDYGILKKFKKMSSVLNYKIILKQLNANKNEVTIMGTKEDLKQQIPLE